MKKIYKGREPTSDNVMESKEVSRRKKVIICFVILEVIGILLCVRESGAGSSLIRSISRPSAGKRKVSEQLQVKDGDEWRDIRITVTPEKYTEQEIEENFKKAREEINTTILGENSSFDKVYKKLNFKTSYVSGAVKATYKCTPFGYIDSDGSIQNDKVESDTLVTIECTLKCQKETEITDIAVKLIPVPADSDMAKEFYLKKSINEAVSDYDSDDVILPTEVNGEKIYWRKPQESSGIKLIFLGIVLIVAAVFLQKESAKKKEKARQRDLSYDYTEILSKLVLFIGAGLSVKSSFETIGRQYEKDVQAGRRTSRPGFDGIVSLNRSIKDGRSEFEAYRDFGDSTGNKNYRKLALLMVQNLKKGNSELLSQLEQESHNAYEERRVRAKRAGEEASTKLLMPMMGLLSVIMMVLIVPALTEMNI